MKTWHVLRLFRSPLQQPIWTSTSGPLGPTATETRYIHPGDTIVFSVRFLPREIITHVLTDASLVFCHIPSSTCSGQLLRKHASKRRVQTQIGVQRKMWNVHCARAFVGGADNSVLTQSDACSSTGQFQYHYSSYASTPIAGCCN